MFKETLCMIAMCMISSLFNIKPANGQDKVCTPLTKLRGPHAQGICGNRIDELLGLFCVNGHNELYPSKRKKRGLSDGIYLFFSIFVHFSLMINVFTHLLESE